MKFDNAAKVEEVVWRMRQSEINRSGNRAILNNQFNGDPPFDEALAEENGVSINRNFLHGVQVLADARRQWNQAFLNTPNYFSIGLDSGPVHKRDEHAMIITDEINRKLKRHRGQMEQSRATGANVMLHGIAPVTWKNKSCPYPVPLPIDAVLIPSETEVDFENLPHFAIFRQYTPAQLVGLTHGEKRDPGWNMKLVNAALKHHATLDVKDLTAYAEMSPERLAEAIKQDGGYWESDAVPTIDAWDFYFLEEENGGGVFRRIILDWSVDVAGDSAPKSPPSRDWTEGSHFLYTSKEQPYCSHIENVLHCQFGDCSAVAPFKYHSIRSLGWLLWGICDLENRLECRFTEAVFENLMWFFRTSSSNDFDRLRKATFHHLGIIPNGISFVSPADRFIPNHQLVEQARTSMRSRIAQTAASYTQDFESGDTRRELTATETMARVNSVNALVAGMMTLAYTYEEYKYVEECRRFSKFGHPDAKDFRDACKKRGVPEKALDSDRWDVKAERVIGAGNKTVELAAVQFLQGIRKNLGPQAQRKVDHISIRSVTDQPDLANDLAPLDEIQQISSSAHDAELASERLLRGLEFSLQKEMVYEEYVIVWLKDLAAVVQRAVATNSADIELLGGIKNLAKYIAQFLQIMATNDEDKPKIKQYQDALGQIMNHVKGIEQRLMEEMKAKQQNGNGEAAKEAVKLQAQQMQAQVKAENSRVAHSQKTAQRQVQFEMDEKRKEQAHAAELERKAESAAADNQIRVIDAAADAAIATEQAKNEPETPTE